MAESLIEGQEIERELAGTALSILVEDGDADLFDKLLKAFKEAEDPWRRSTLLQGLAGFRRSEISLELKLSALRRTTGERDWANCLGAFRRLPSAKSGLDMVEENLTQLREKSPAQLRALPALLSKLPLHCQGEAGNQ